MESKNINGYLNLEKNLEAMIHEGTVKIGFVEGETINIYYDYNLLQHLLGLEDYKEADIRIELDKFTHFINKNWGFVEIRVEKKRYKFSVSPIGVKYVYKKNINNTFLKDLILKTREKDCSIESILEVFYYYSKDVICEKSTNSEFDYIIYFKDTNIDSFKYCFSFNEMGNYYHRLTYYDYEKL